jgi:signal transduction histidine kinase
VQYTFQVIFGVIIIYFAAGSFFFTFYIDKFISFKIHRIANVVFIIGGMLLTSILSIYDLMQTNYPIAFLLTSLIFALFIREEITVIISLLFGNLLFFSSSLFIIPDIPDNLLWTINSSIFSIIAFWLSRYSNIKEKKLFYSLREIEEKKNQLQKKNEDLVKLKEVAENASSAKSEFLANINHEIRTPLHNIQGFLELFALTPLTKEQNDYIRIITKNSMNLLEIVNEVLDYSKIESGKFEIDTRECDIVNLVDSVIETFFHRSQERGIKFYSFVDPGIPSKVIADPLRIKQILNNLLSNAVKFTQKHGMIHVEISLDSYNDESVRILFSVTDTGIGIPEYKLEQIFQSFLQEHKSITGQYGGTGLGLTITKNLVEMMGGTIEVESKKGEGSRFFFTLQFKIAINVSLIQHSSTIVKKCCIITIPDEQQELNTLLFRYLKAFNTDTMLLPFSEFEKESNKTSDFDFIFSTDPERYEKQSKPEINSKTVLVEPVQTIPVCKEKSADLLQPLNPQKINKALQGKLFRNRKDTTAEVEKKKSKVQYQGKILIAEDNSESRKLMLLMLEGHGLELDTAHNGLEAITKTQKFTLRPRVS